MCGIYGLFGTDPDRAASTDTLRAMGETLVHRGPDAEGTHVDGALAIGMRRLSIIDLATGDQPIANEDGSLWVVLNGEIYNYRELRTELGARGHRFRSTSDTEVIVHLYEEHGASCVDRLRGMFAFAVWDARRRELFIARDRLGIKPLYYAATPEGFAFASELKALQACAWLSPRVDPTALAAYLRYGYVPDPWSILDGVRKLPPGHRLVVREGRPSAAGCYWTPTAFFREPRLTRGEDDLADELWARLSDAVQSHLVSDVPVGAFLSGGVDSSALVAVMAAASSAPIETFSVGFEADAYDELPYARRVAARFGTRHHELVARAGDVARLDEIVASFDEPFADSSAIPTFLVARLARERVKVVLSGDGGDELFAGYDRYVTDHRRRVIGLAGDVGVAAPLRHVSRALPEGTPGKRYLYMLSLPRAERYVDAVSVFSAPALADVLEPEFLPRDERHAVWAEDLDPLSRLQDFDLRTYLPGDILTKVDRATMANSIEARVPLLDHSLVEFACRLPASLRLRAGRTKYLLKRALEGRVPREVVTRPKRGFGVPLERWFSRELPEFFRDRLDGATGLRDAGVRPGAVRALLGRFTETRRREYSERLWALVVLDDSLRRLSEVRA